MQSLYALNTNCANRTSDVNNKSVCYSSNMWNGRNDISSTSNTSKDNNSNKDSKTFVRKYDMFVNNTASSDCFSTPASSAENNVLSSYNMYNDTVRVNGLDHEHTHQTSMSARNCTSYGNQSPHETHLQMHDAARMIHNNSRMVHNTNNDVDVMSQTLPLHNSNYNSIISNHSNNNNNCKVTNVNCVSRSNLNCNNSNIVSSVNSVYPITPNLFDIVPPSPSLVPMTLPIPNTAAESMYSSNNVFSNNTKSVLLAVPAVWATSQGPVTLAIPLPTSSLKNVQVDNFQINKNKNKNENENGNDISQTPICYVPFSPSTQISEQQQQEEQLKALLLSSHVAPVLTSPQNATHAVNMQLNQNTTSQSQWSSANYPNYTSTCTTVPVESYTDVKMTSFTPASSMTMLPSQSIYSVENNNNINVNANTNSQLSHTSQTQQAASAAASATQLNFSASSNTNNCTEYVNNVMTISNTSCTSINSSPSRHGSRSSIILNVSQLNSNTTNNNNISKMEFQSERPQNYRLPSQLQTNHLIQVPEIDSIEYSRHNSSSLSNSNANQFNNTTGTSIYSINSTPPVMSEPRHLPLFVQQSNEFISPPPPPPPPTVLLPHKNSLSSSSFSSSSTSLAANGVCAVKATTTPPVQIQIHDQTQFSPQENSSLHLSTNQCTSRLQHEDFSKRESVGCSESHYNHSTHSPPSQHDEHYHSHHNKHNNSNDDDGYEKYKNTVYVTHREFLHSPLPPPPPPPHHHHGHGHLRNYVNSVGNSQIRNQLNENEKNIIKNETNYDCSDTAVSTNTIRLPITDYDVKRVWHDVLQNERHLNYPNVPLPNEFANLGDSEERRRRLEQRHKQIMYGKDTEGYLKYITLIPQVAQREFHNPMHPITPRPENDCSKRTFDKYLNSWRRQLHQWDECDLNYLSREFTPMKVATLGDLHLATLNTSKDATTTRTESHNINTSTTSKEEEVGKCTPVEADHEEYVCTETHAENEQLFHNFTEKELEEQELDYEKELKLLEQEFELQDNSMVIPTHTFSSTLSTPSSDDFFFFCKEDKNNTKNVEYCAKKEINKPTSLSFSRQSNKDNGTDNMIPRKMTNVKHDNKVQSTDCNSCIDSNTISSSIENTNNVNYCICNNDDKLEFTTKDEFSSGTLNELMTNSALHLTDTTSSTITENSNNNCHDNKKNESYSIIDNLLYKADVNDPHYVSTSGNTQRDVNHTTLFKPIDTLAVQTKQISESLNTDQSNAGNWKKEVTNNNTKQTKNESMNCSNDDHVVIDDSYDDEEDDDDSFMNEFNHDMPSLNLTMDITTPESTLEYILSERVSNVPSAWTPSQISALDAHKRNNFFSTLSTTPMTIISPTNGACVNGETTINTVTSGNNKNAKERTNDKNGTYEKENRLMEVLTPVSPKINRNRSERSCGFMSLSRPQTMVSEVVPEKDEPVRVREYTCTTSSNKKVDIVKNSKTTRDKDDNSEEDSFDALLDDVLGKVCSSSRSTSQLTSLPQVKKSCRATTFDSTNININNINNENKKINNNNNNNNYSEIKSHFSSPSPTPPSSRRTKQSLSSIRIPLRKIVNNSDSSNNISNNISSAHLIKEKNSMNNDYKRLSSIASLNPLSGRCSETQLSLPSLNQTGVSSSAASLNNIMNNNKNYHNTNISGSNNFINDYMDVADDHDNN